MTTPITPQKAFADINGLHMYYEIHGEGKPLVLIHGGGSTIETTFGRIIPELAKSRQIIAVELQAHGHTNDRNTNLSFEQDADDVAALLQMLAIPKADFLGFSNGGGTTIEIAIRHPSLINKMIICSSLSKRSGTFPQFWSGFNNATLDMMPAVLREGYLAANNSEAGLQNTFNKDVQRMTVFKGWDDAKLKAINFPVLLINGNKDVATLEHAVEMHRLFPNSELVIFPGTHGTYLGAIEALENGVWPRFNAVSLIEEFLDK